MNQQPEYYRAKNACGMGLTTNTLKSSPKCHQVRKGGYFPGFAGIKELGWCQDNGNRSNQESKFDFQHH